MIFYWNDKKQKCYALRCPKCKSEPILVQVEQIIKRENKVDHILYLNCPVCDEINVLKVPQRALTGVEAVVLWNNLTVDYLCSRVLKSCTAFLELFGRDS